MIKTRQDGTELTVYLHGEIDHCIAQSIRDEIETILRKSRIMHLILDFSQVSFMDSSGLGLILGRFTKATELGIVFKVQNPTPQIKRILDLAGTERLIKIENNSGRRQAVR